jgi:hypothetical protein
VGHRDTPSWCRSVRAADEPRRALNFQVPTFNFNSEEAVRGGGILANQAARQSFPPYRPTLLGNWKLEIGSWEWVVT